MLTDYAPHMQPGEKKHVANSFTPGDVIMHQFLSHVSFSFPLQAERAAEGASEKGRLLKARMLSRHVCAAVLSVGSLEPSRV